MQHRIKLAIMAALVSLTAIGCPHATSGVEPCVGSHVSPIPCAWSIEYVDLIVRSGIAAPVRWHLADVGGTVRITHHTFVIDYANPLLATSGR